MRRDPVATPIRASCARFAFAIYGGRPRSVRDAAVNAAAGCAMSVGMKAIEDVGGWLSGS